MGNLGELATPIQYFIVFVVVLALIVLIFWAIRRFGGASLGTAAVRSRQPRLAVIDAAAVDTRRRLVLIRRDNVEHLLMIGGPTDIVVEQNIIRGSPATSGREAPLRREPMPDTAPVEQDIPIPRHEAAPRAPGEPGQTEPAMPRAGELTGLRPEWPARGEKAAKPDAVQQPPPPPDIAQAVRPGPTASVPPARAPEAPGRSQMPAPFSGTPKPAPEPVVSAQSRPAPPASDAELTDMAHRLEAALRRSGGPVPVRNEPVLSKPAAAPEKPAQPSPLPFGGPGARSGEAGKPAPKPEPPRPLRAEPPPPTEPDPKGKSVLDSLEQEMASLLGRPIGKE